MKIMINILFIILFINTSYAVDEIQSKFENKLNQINQLQIISDQLASSAEIELHQYQYLKDAGFKHMINLSTRLHLVERTHAEALGMSYVQIRVPLDGYSEELFIKFIDLMVGYGNEKVIVYSEQNWRAIAFAYRYQSGKDGTKMLAAQ